MPLSNIYSNKAVYNGGNFRSQREKYALLPEQLESRLKETFKNVEKAGFIAKKQ